MSLSLRIADLLKKKEMVAFVGNLVGRPRLHRVLDPGVVEDVSKHSKFLSES